MNKKTTSYITILILLFLIGFLVVISLNKKALNEEPAVEIDNGNDSETAAETINVYHQYAEGSHTFVGALYLPTPCHSYNVEAIKEDGETQIAISTSIDPDEICAQVITERTFRVSFTAPEEENITGTLNGEVINLNIFEIPEGTDIEDYELIIKG